MLTHKANDLPQLLFQQMVLFLLGVIVANKYKKPCYKDIAMNANLCSTSTLL